MSLATSSMFYGVFSKSIQKKVFGADVAKSTKGRKTSSSREYTKTFPYQTLKYKPNGKLVGKARIRS